MSASTYALLGSVAVHGAVALWLATRPPPTAAASRARSIVEFEFLASSALVPPPEEAPAPAAPEPEPVLRHAREKRTPPRTPEAASAAPSDQAKRSAEPASASVAAVPATVTIEAPSSAPAPSRARPLDLSPLAAALTMRDSLLAPNSCGVALAGTAANCGGDAGASAAKHELPAGPRSLIALRKEAHLKPQADGSYTFDSPSFHATVSPDGRVAFEDKLNDLNSFVERKVVGVQINTAEKRRFMESTAALREQLADAAEAQNQRRAAVTLQSTLRAVLADAKLSLEQKRTAIFGLWDDCASDASGSAAQAAIESFVGTHLPEGSPLAYSAADLAQLNRRRASRRTFDPYGAADAGVRPG